MNRKTKILLFFLWCPFIINAQQIDPVTKVYTDFNGFWESSLAPGNPVPNDLHSMLGFQWNGTNFSTGVDDAKLTTNGITYSPQSYQAFPPVSIPNPSGTTYIGVGVNYGGAGNVTPVPVNNYLIQYLTDGSKGLGFGTAIYNFPSGSEIAYEITSGTANSGIAVGSIGDGIPDIVFTQVGQISAADDAFRFVNAANTTVGTTVHVDFQNSTPTLANPEHKFYNTNAIPPTYNSGLSNPGHRPLRMLALDWSEFGITTTNYLQVKHLIQTFSGQSDIAFTAYNTNSITILQSISGVVFNDNNAETPDGMPYQGATVRLYSANNLTTPLFTATTGNNGAYVFPNLGAGDYRIELVTPTGFHNVSESDTTPNGQLDVTLGSFALINRNFGINQAPTANPDSGTGEKTYPISINISSNDTDPNSGTVVPSTISLLPPSGATSVVTDANGYIKSFSVANVGSWSVNSSGVLTFTPVATFTGTPPTIQYIIKDQAGLISNAANVTFTVLEYCTRIPTNLTGGNPSKFGISTQKTKLPNWPESVPNGHLVLESTKKGFVITRVQNSNLITDAKEGMIIYDIDAACIKLFNGTNWNCIARSCNQ